jgi:subtilisin family serine protease
VVNVARLPHTAPPARPARPAWRVLAVVPALTAALAFALPANAGQTLTAARTDEWWLTALGVPGAWQAAPQAGKGVTVAVLSTGVDATHPDLAGSVVTGPDFSKTGRVSGGPYWGAEGTAVASLIAGHGHGSAAALGISGVAPHARILSVQVTQEYDDPHDGDAAIMRQLPDAIAMGIRYAVSHGATVIALPLDPGLLGVSAERGNAGAVAAGGSAAERAAVSYALAHNVLLVAPAGDNGAAGDAVNYPAAYPGVIAVGATARDGQLSPFTSEQSYVTLTAPGSGVTRHSPQWFGPLTTDPATGLTVAAPDDGYDSLASTDMAAALISGVAAVIRSSYPGLTGPQIIQALDRGAAVPRAVPSAAAGQRAANGADGLAGWGHGTLNAAAALNAAKAIAAAHPASAPATAASAASATASPRQAAGQPASGARHARQAPAADPGQTLRTLLIDLVLAAGALIVALTAVLVIVRLRRRPDAAARQARAAGPGYAGTHVRRLRTDGNGAPAVPAVPAVPVGAPVSPRYAPPPGGDFGSQPGMPVRGVGGRAGPGAAAGPHPAVDGMANRAPATGPSWADSAWSTRSAAAWQETVAVPGWTTPTTGGDGGEYASHEPPGDPGLPAGPLPPLPTPPWEQPGVNFLTAPIPAAAPASWPPPNTGTGPLYVWNPAAATAPLRALDEDQGQ